jgi:hypothetical protein
MNSEKSMKRGENFLLDMYKKGKIRLFLYKKIENFLKNLSHIPPVFPTATLKMK